MDAGLSATVATGQRAAALKKCKKQAKKKDSKEGLDEEAAQEVQEEGKPSVGLAAVPRTG